LLLQAGNVPGTGSQDTFFPAINVNVVGDITVTYGRSSSSVTGDMMIASRRASDPPGTMGLPVVMQTSAGSSYGGVGQNRWGDYFSSQVDPVDDTKFWGVGMVSSAAGQWETYIHNWSVSSGLINYVPFSITTYQGSFLSGSLADVTTSNNTYYSVRSAPLGKLGQVGAVEVKFQLDQPVSKLDALSIKVEGQASAAATGMIWLKNVTTGEYEHVKSFPLSGADSTDTVQLSGNLARYVDGLNQVNAIVRGLVPNRTNAVAVQFTTKIDMINLLIRWKP
jgi:hypothetical protein